nr:recombinase family protein [Novosphingobium piscinae]
MGRRQSAVGRRCVSLWTRARVSRVLSNFAYVGDNVWGRTSGRLCRKRVTTRPELWVYASDVFEPVVERGLFNEARSIIQAKVCKLTNAELLTRLASLLDRHGTLSARLINDDPELPDANVCAYRFGGLMKIYQLLGHSPRICLDYVELNQSFKQVRAGLISLIAVSLDRAGILVTRATHADQLIVNHEISLSVHVARCHALNSGNMRWQTRGFRSKATDINVIARMDPSNSAISEYYIIPRAEVTYGTLNIDGTNAPDFSGYRYSDLTCLPQMLQPTHISEVV